MSLQDPYCDVFTYRSITKKSDERDDVEVEMDLLAISRWLDRKTNRFFGRDDEPVARVFDPAWTEGGRRTRGFYPGWAEAENPWVASGMSRLLMTDDMSEAPTLIIPDSGYGFDERNALDPHDYELWPPNADRQPEPKPWLGIVNLGWGFGGGRVQITCRWGWPQIPPAITVLTAELCAIWRLESPRATTQVNELEQAVGTSQAASSMVEKICRDYVRADRLI